MRSWWRPVLFFIISIIVNPDAADAQSAGLPVVTLEEAVRRALEHDPAAIAAEGVISSAEADRLEARGSWLPSISLNSTYGNSSNQRFDQATGQLVSESYTAAASASYEIFGGGRRFFQNRSVSARVKAAEASYRAQYFQTVLRTTESFYAAAAAKEMVGVAEQRLARARQQLEFANTRLEVGTATRSDLLRAEIEVGNAELALVDAESALHTAQLDLGRLIGVEGGVAPATYQLPERAPPLPAGEELVRQGERTSPELQAARATLEERSAGRWAVYGAYIPTVRLTGGYDWLSHEFPPSNRSWSLRVTASLPLFNGFQREATVARVNAAERTARARARDTELGLRVAVADARRAIESAERRVEIASRAVELAKEDLRVQEERYQIGSATIIELQTSQVTLAGAEADYVRARQALGVAVARLEAVIGERIGGDD